MEKRESPTAIRKSHSTIFPAISHPRENRRDAANFRGLFSRARLVSPLSRAVRSERRKGGGGRETKISRKRIFPRDRKSRSRRGTSVRAVNSTRASFPISAPGFPPSAPLVAALAHASFCTPCHRRFFLRNYYPEPATTAAAPVGPSVAETKRRYRFPLTATNSNFARIANVNWPPE